MKKNILILVFFLSTYNYLYAGFPVGKGRSVISLAYNFYYSTSNFDTKWHRYSDKPGDYFMSHYLSAYIAHGISRKLDIFASIPFVLESSRNDSVFRSRNDFVDCMLGFSYTFINKTYNKYLSFKLAGIWPLYHGTTPLAIGYGATGVDFTTNYVYSPKSLRNKGYYMFEGSYRHYFDTEGPDQFLFDIERSYTINRFHYLLFGVSGTYSSSINKSTIINPLLSKDFIYMDIKATYGQRVRRNLTLYLEGFYTPVGRNTGVGLGAVFLTVFKFP